MFKKMMNLLLLGVIGFGFFYVHTPLGDGFSDAIPNVADMILNKKFAALICFAAGIFLAVMLVNSMLPGGRSAPVDRSPTASGSSSSTKTTRRGGTGDGAGPSGSDGGASGGTGGDGGE